MYNQLMSSNILSIRNLNTSVSERIVHNNISFDIRMPGEIVLLTGQSGSGKSTLIDFITGEIPDADGSMLWNNAAITHNELQKRIALSPQHGGLISHYTILENIKLTIQAAFDLSDDIATELAYIRGRMANLTASTLYKYPWQLSGGMKRCASLARAISSEPEILILDEPFAGLDYDSTRKIRDLILSLTNVSILCVTHVPMPAHKYLFLHYGSLYEVTKYSDTSQFPKIIKKMVSVFKCHQYFSSYSYILSREH